MDDHEISSRCYVLDIGIRGVEDKIWVRIRMFEFAEKSYADSLCNSGNTLSPCLVITGQPGIGEFLLMILPLVLLTYQILFLGKSLWHW